MHRIIWILVGMLSTTAVAQDLSVQLDTGGEDWVARSAAISLELSRWPAAEEGRLGVLVGQTDRTDLFRRDGLQLVYRPELLPLPPGESEIAVFLVATDGAWQEIARHPLRVLLKGGVESFEWRPSLDVETRYLHDPGDPPVVEESNEAEVSGQIRLGLSASRSGWNTQLDLGVVGTSEIEQALRFYEEGEEAPRVDLESYLFSLSKGRGRFEVGHVQFGQSRHLIDGFASRGVALTLPLGSRIELGATALNGTQIAGWDNVLGLSESQHRVYAGSVAAELLARPGALRLTGTFVDASLLPLSDFNQGLLQDREESSGWSGHLEGSSPGGRISFRGGFARSTFDNPEDPFLSQGDDLVAVEEETRDAYYGELDLALVQGATIGEDLPVDVQLSLRHQRVDPLYRSAGVFVQPDLEESAAELQASFGAVTAQGGYIRSEDNLDDIPSILKTKTRQGNGAFFLPLAQVAKRADGTERRWLPALSYNYGRTHQFGDSLPVDGGFNPSHVPDQVSITHDLNLDWQGNLWRLGALFGLSDQDNRQPGREQNDFETRTQGLSFSLTPHGTLDLSLDLSDEEAEDLAAFETDETLRVGLNLNWRFAASMSLEAIASRSDNENAPKTRENLSTDYSLQWTWRFDRTGERHGFSGQFHVLYARTEVESRDLIFGFDDQFEQWTLTAGLSFSLF